MAQHHLNALSKPHHILNYLNLWIYTT